MKPHLPISLFASLILGLSAASNVWAAGNKNVTADETLDTVDQTEYDNIRVQGASLTVTTGGSLVTTSAGQTHVEGGGALTVTGTEEGEGGSLTTNFLLIGSNGATAVPGDQLNLEKGVITVTSTNKSQGYTWNAGVALGYQGGTSASLNISGGTFNALQCYTLIGSAGDGQLNISGGTANLYATYFNNSNSRGTITLSDSGTLNLGAGGMIQNDTRTTKFVYLNGGTLGVINSSWNANNLIKIVLGEGHTTRVNTADSAGTGYTVDLQGSISGSGALEKVGEGTLKISGTVDAGSSATFKATSGTIDFTGATLATDATTTVQLNGGVVDNLGLTAGVTLSQQASGGELGNLTLDGGTISFAGLDNAGYAMTETGTLSFGTAITTLDFTDSANYGDGSVLISNVTLADSSTWSDGGWTSFFSLNGLENMKVVYDESSTSFMLASDPRQVLTWSNEAGDATWDTVSYTWGDGSTTFNEGDEVTFAGTSATVTVQEGGVGAYQVTVGDGADLTWAGGNVTGPVTINNSSTLRLENTLNGRVTFGDSTSKLVLNSTDSLGSVSTITGSGVVQINWGAGEGTNIDSQLAGFTGTLSITRDSVLAVSSTLGVSAVEVAAGSKIALSSTTALAESASVTGEGTVELKWGAESGALTTQLAGFRGELLISSGRYNAASADAVTPLNNVNKITVSDGGQLYLGIVTTFTNDVTIAGTGWNASTDIVKAGAIRLDNGGSMSGNITLAADANVIAYNGTSTIAGSITGDHVLTKAGSGTIVLSGTSTDASHIYVNGGALNVSGTISGTDKSYTAGHSESGNNIYTGTLRIVTGGALNTANAEGKGVSVTRANADATITRTTISATGISREEGYADKGSVSNAQISIDAETYSIGSVTLTNSLVSMQVGRVTLTDVAITGTTMSGQGADSIIQFSGTTTLTLPSDISGSATTGTASLYTYDISSYFTNATLDGDLVLDISSFVNTVPGSYDQIAFAFGDSVTLANDLTVSITPNYQQSPALLAGTISGNVVYFNTSQVPEPTTAALGILGLTGLMLRRRRRA